MDEVVGSLPWWLGARWQLSPTQQLTYCIQSATGDTIGRVKWIIFLGCDKDI